MFWNEYTASGLVAFWKSISHKKKTFGKLYPNSATSTLGLSQNYTLGPVNVLPI